MKLRILTAALLLLAAFSFDVKVTKAQDIKWISLEQAEKLNANKKTQRKVFVDVYTDWCGWCKRLDATTYKDPEVVKYINENFYAVKLNAETRDTVKFKGTKYAYDPARKINPVATSFLTPQPGYPTLTYLDEKLSVVSVAPGYVSKDDLMKKLRYIHDNYYLNMSFDKFVSTGGKPAESK